MTARGVGDDRLQKLESLYGVKINIEPEKGCWFILGRDWSNYTTIKKEKGHRLVYRLFLGPLVSGREICHRCDRKGCINPDHLFQGTHSDNMNDSLDKGRTKKLLVNPIDKDLRRRDNWKQLVRFCR